MYSLRIDGIVRPGKNHEFLKTWSDHILPLFKGQNGFLDVMLLFEEGAAAVSSISFWNTREDREHYQHNVFFHATRFVEHLLDGAPVARALDATSGYLSPRLQLLWRGEQALEHARAKKIFVVDDEKPIADLLSTFLGDAQFDVETFYDAHSALQRANDCPPDLLVSDVVMPEINGVTLAKALRVQHPHCKIILMSGNPDWTRGVAHGDGLDGFTLLSKPFPLKRLLHIIKSDMN